VRQIEKYFWNMKLLINISDNLLLLYIFKCKESLIFEQNFKWTKIDKKIEKFLIYLIKLFLLGLILDLILYLILGLFLELIYLLFWYLILDLILDLVFYLILDLIWYLIYF